MSRLRTRVSKLEAAHQERLDAACKRLVRLLSDEELEAIVAVRDGDVTPEAEAGVGDGGDMVRLRGRAVGLERGAAGDLMVVASLYSSDGDLMHDGIRNAAVRSQILQWWYPHGSSATPWQRGDLMVARRPHGNPVQSGLPHAVSWKLENLMDRNGERWQTGGNPMPGKIPHVSEDAR